MGACHSVMISDLHHIPYLLKTVGEDHFVIGSDYGYTDTSAEIEALRRLKDSSEISPEAARKNPRREPQSA